MPIRFPLKIIRHEQSFGIKDAAGTPVCFFYFTEGRPDEIASRNKLPRDEAEELAKITARAITEAKSQPT